MVIVISNENIYVEIPHKNRLSETVLMRSPNICFYGENKDNYH